MTQWTQLSDAEMERRRQVSIAAQEQTEREDFDARYRETCDRQYWTEGQCCAGCDHWHSDMCGLGQCAAAGIVSGQEIMNGVGMLFCSYTPPPGLPFSRADFHCGKFKDDFRWESLDREYLRRIGALTANGKLREKPRIPAKFNPSEHPFKN